MQAGTATVIGSTGFIGQALLLHLRAAGWSCWAPDRDQPWPLQQRELGHVFYCAGLTADYLRRPEETVQAHVGLLTRVLQSDSYLSLVYLSSTRLYDNLPGDALATEDAPLCISPLNSRHFYDLTKLTGESLCQVLGEGRARVARLSCVYQGAGEGQGFLPGLLLRLQDSAPGATLSVPSSPHFARDYVHLEDVVRALLDIAVRGCQPIYNVAAGANLGNDQLAHLVQAHSGRHLAYTLDQAHAPAAVAAIQRLQAEFGWCPTGVEERLAPWLRRLPV